MFIGCQPSSVAILAQAILAHVCPSLCSPLGLLRVVFFRVHVAPTAQPCLGALRIAYHKTNYSPLAHAQLWTALERLLRTGIVEIGITPTACGIETRWAFVRSVSTRRRRAARALAGAHQSTNCAMTCTINAAENASDRKALVGVAMEVAIGARRPTMIQLPQGLPRGCGCKARCGVTWQKAPGRRWQISALSLKVKKGVNVRCGMYRAGKSSA